jgi:hypothetical protein
MRTDMLFGSKVYAQNWFSRLLRFTMERNTNVLPATGAENVAVRHGFACKAVLRADGRQCVS